jgi:hypothetical protein
MVRLFEGDRSIRTWDDFCRPLYRSCSIKPGGIFVIILKDDGSLTIESIPERAARGVKDTIEVREDLVAQQPDLIDRIFTFAFDVLDLRTIDLAIRPVSVAGDLD